MGIDARSFLDFTNHNAVLYTTFADGTKYHVNFFKDVVLNLTSTHSVPTNSQIKPSRKPYNKQPVHYSKLS